ncbi:DUF1926 domain-containing protein [bacterium]|nr:MAG: DUF1926 domain-containing protein [bacterium]
MKARNLHGDLLYDVFFRASGLNHFLKYGFLPQAFHLNGIVNRSAFAVNCYSAVIIGDRHYAHVHIRRKARIQADFFLAIKKAFWQG